MGDRLSPGALFSLGRLESHDMLVKIYTFADKRPDFIRWQKRTFDHFLEDEYRFIVVNNASSLNNGLEIERICDELGVMHIPLDEKHHENPNVACAYPIDYALRQFISREREANFSIIIDSDMFLMRSFSVGSLGNHWIAALPQRRGHVRYIWNGLVFINHQTIRDIDEMCFCCSACKGVCPFFDADLWHGNTIEGQVVDVGGAMYFYLLKRHPDCRIKYLTSTHHITPARRNLHHLPNEILKNYDPEYCFEMVDQTFVHYGSGSNWKGQSAEYHERKTKLARELVEGVIADRIEIPSVERKAVYIDPGYAPSQYLSSLGYFARRGISSLRNLRRK